MTAGSGRSPASTGFVKRTAPSVMVPDAAREPLGHGLDRAPRAHVARLVDVAVPGAGLDAELGVDSCRCERRGERLARGTQVVVLADDDEGRREPVAVAESGEGPRGGEHPRRAGEVL